MKRDPLEDGIRAMWEDTPEHLLAALDDHIKFVGEELGKGVWSLLALKVMIETVASLQDRIAALEEQLAKTEDKADRADARGRLYGPSGGLSPHETITPPGPGSRGWGRMPPREGQVGPGSVDLILEECHNHPQSAKDLIEDLTPPSTEEIQRAWKEDLRKVAGRDREENAIPGLLDGVVYNANQSIHHAKMAEVLVERIKRALDE